jgi:hypothetical protein
VEKPGPNLLAAALAITAAAPVTAMKLTVRDSPGNTEVPIPVAPAIGSGWYHHSLLQQSQAWRCSSASEIDKWENFMSEPAAISISRRHLVGGALGALGMAGAMSAAAAEPMALEAAQSPTPGEAVDWEVITFDSAEEKFKHFMRMAYGIDEEQFVFWAMLTYTYFKPGMMPVPIFGKEAMELSQAKQMRTNVWQVQGNNLSFPRDIETGEYITEFANPVTGEMVPVPSAKVADDDPGLIITPEGNRAIGMLDMEPMSSRITFRREGPYVSMHRIRPNPRRFGFTDWPTDFIELGTQRVLAEDFYNPNIRHLYGTASATFLLPAVQRWVPIDKAPEMAGGYIVAHIDSLKLPSVNHMPAAFREHAEELGHSHLLKMDQSRFRDDV